MKVNYEKHYLEIIPESPVEEAYLESLILHGKTVRGTDQAIILKLDHAEVHGTYSNVISYLTTEITEITK